MTQVSYDGPSDVPGSSESHRVTISLAAPATRNALSRALVADLVAGLDRAAADERVRVVVLAAAGPAFCAGADLGEALADGMGEAARGLVALQRRILTLPVPVVARVHGAARAGGLGLVAACDLAVGADEATYALTEVRLGLAAAAISPTVLARLTSRAASDLLLSGRTIGGREAADLGLITSSVPAADLDAAVDEVCTRIERGHPQGLRETKRLLTADVVRRLDADGEDLAALSARLFASPAAREAMAAFLRRSD